MKKQFILLLFLIIGTGGTLLSQEKVWSLEECIRYAIDNNIQIKQQVVQTKLQKNSLDLARLKILPTLNGQASHDFLFGRSADITTYQYHNQSTQQEFFYLGGNMNLFNGLQILNTIKKSKFDLLAGEQDLQSIKDNVGLNVAMAYLQILLNKELVAATDAQLQITLQQIEKTKKLVDAGSMARGNLLQIEAQAAQEEVQLITLKNQLETSYLNLTQLLELKTPVGFEIVSPVINVDSTAIVTGNIDEIYASAQGTRPEVKSAELNLASSESALSIARGARSPQLSLSHSVTTRYVYINNTPGNLPFKDQIKNNKNYDLGFSLNIPILNGWQVNKNVSNSKLEIQKSQYALEAAKKTLYKNIQQAYTDALAALKKYNSSRKAVTSSEESFRYTEQKFNVGLVTPVDYNAGKTQLLNAQSDLAQAKYEFIFKIKVLDFYKGIPLNLSKL
jgi:outer membrane protein